MRVNLRQCVSCWTRFPLYKDAQLGIYFVHYCQRTTASWNWLRRPEFQIDRRWAGCPIRDSDPIWGATRDSDFLGDAPLESSPYSVLH
jgi:hypothetical protein